MGGGRVLFVYFSLWHGVRSVQERSVGRCYGCWTRPSLVLADAYSPHVSVCLSLFVLFHVASDCQTHSHYISHSTLLICTDAPLTRVEEIDQRLDGVAYFHAAPDLCADVRSILRRCHDIERCLQRLGFSRGSPRDVYAVATTLIELRSIADRLTKAHAQPLPALLAEAVEGLSGVDVAVAQNVVSALVPEPPSQLSDGEFIRKGYAR